jgi:2',3'-cyclic-nucleotide 2'-phosphodiesterase (5'-nucleotidase family)
VRRLVVLHTNDIHGRVGALVRIATLVERERASAGDAAVLYVDAGDVEDFTNRLSNLTKGVAMHRLLRVAGCRAVAVGNGAVIRYGPDPLPAQAAAGGYPQLAANLLRDGRVAPGVEARALLDVDGVRVGLVGLTPTNWRDIYEGFFGLELPEEPPLVREHVAALRGEGADLVVLLSHLGIERDRELAAELGGAVDLVVGSHSHTLLTEGEQIAGLTIVQAGEFGEYLGRVELELEDGGVRIAAVRVEPVTDDVTPHPALVAEVEAIERELEAWLGEVVGVLEKPLELADDRECSAGAFMAEVVREYMGAEVGAVTAGVSFAAPLPAGPLTRGALYEACPSPGNPGAAGLTGAQLAELVERGRDPELAADRPYSALRGRARGLMHLSGAEVRGGHLLVGDRRVEPDRVYRVAASDWELDAYGGYAQAGWELEIEYAQPLVIMREAVEGYLARRAAP